MDNYSYSIREYTKSDNKHIVQTLGIAPSIFMDDDAKRPQKINEKIVLETWIRDKSGEVKSENDEPAFITKYTNQSKEYSIVTHSWFDGSKFVRGGGKAAVIEEYAGPVKNATVELYTDELGSEFKKIEHSVFNVAPGEPEVYYERLSTFIADTNGMDSRHPYNKNRSSSVRWRPHSFNGIPSLVQYGGTIYVNSLGTVDCKESLVYHRFGRMHHTHAPAVVVESASGDNIAEFHYNGLWCKDVLEFAQHTELSESELAMLRLNYG
tara:strand:- start:2887 stop:3684 length:798 start_codon:yes stop_codon:yes gene_type:complete